MMFLVNNDSNRHSTQECSLTLVKKRKTGILNKLILLQMNKMPRSYNTQ